MKQTKKITISAMCIALGVVFMALGAVIEVLDLTVAAMCSCLMAFVFIEVGDKYAIAVWIGTSILGLVFFTHSLVWVTYLLVFGMYPILKAYIERLKRPLWIPVKISLFVVCAILVILASEMLLGIPFFSDDFGLPILEKHTEIFKILVVCMFIGALYVYDVFMTVMIRSYFSIFRKRIQHLLK